MILIKSLEEDGSSRHKFRLPNGSKYWPLPYNDSPGPWLELPGTVRLKPHYSGFHLVKPEAAIGWCWQRNFIAEAHGAFKESEECIVTRKMRLTQELYLSPEKWAKLAVGYMHDVIRAVIEINYPWDHIRAALDAYNHAVEKFNHGKKQICYDQGKRSPEKYAKKHVQSLIKRCDYDKKVTVEMGYNAKGVLYIAQGIYALTKLGKRGKAASQNWKIAKDVASYARDAAEQFMMQPLTRYGVAHNKKPPKSLRKFLPKDQPKNLAPLEISRELLHRQSARLCQAWGLNISPSPSP